MSIEATANFIGKEGFNWWIGQVENDGAGTFWKEVRENVGGELLDVFSGKGFDTSDWDWTNKVKVRIVGYHSPNKADLPTEDLPWALCLMPVTSPQRSGIGGHHQLQINGWVIGFFLDGAAAQIPIVMGAVGDENPVGAYGTEKGSETGFAQLAAPEYDERVHGSSGSGVPGTGNTIETDDNTGLDTASTKSDGKGGEGSTVNPRGGDEQYSASQKAADDAKKVTVQVGNGKCGSETATKLEGPLAEFMKWARGVKQNSIGEYIEEATGDVADMDLKISQTAARIQRKMLGLTANIKGVVMEDVEKRVNEKHEDLGKVVKSLEKELAEKSEEIMSIRESKRIFSDRQGQGDWKKAFENDIIDAKFMGLATGKGFENDYAKSVMEKVNAHSGVGVSSADFEQVVSTNIERDIQNELVLAPLFREIPMTSATQIIPILPDSGYAEFTANQAASGSSPHGNLAQRGDAYNPGSAGGIDMTERTLSTKKLISTSFIGNETEEDAILPILPLIRESMVRSHARAIENAILVGDDADGAFGTSGASFEGLCHLAANDSNTTQPSGTCLLYTSPSPRDRQKSRMPSSA